MTCPPKLILIFVIGIWHPQHLPDRINDVLVTLPFNFLATSNWRAHEWITRGGLVNSVVGLSLECQKAGAMVARLTARTLLSDVLHVGLPLDMFGCKLPLKRTPMWVINLRDMLEESLTRPAHRRFTVKVKKLGQIITYATGIQAGITIDFHPMCWRRPKRLSCEGVLQIEMRKDFIYWHCPVCGDEGVVTGWRGLIWDMTEFRSPIES